MPNPSPSVQNRFGPGNKVSAKPRNSTNALALENAKMAVLLRRRILVGFMRKMRDDPDYIPALDADVLRLIKDSEDRGLGSPNQNISVENHNVPTLTVNPTKLSNEALAELVNAMDEGEILEAEIVGEEPTPTWMPEDDDISPDDPRLE